MQLLDLCMKDCKITPKRLYNHKNTTKIMLYFANILPNVLPQFLFKLFGQSREISKTKLQGLIKKI
jgi:hypothetical protein